MCIENILRILKALVVTVSDLSATICAKGDTLGSKTHQPSDLGELSAGSFP